MMLTKVFKYFIVDANELLGEIFNAKLSKD